LEKVEKIIKPLQVADLPAENKLRKRIGGISQGWRLLQEGWKKLWANLDQQQIALYKYAASNSFGAISQIDFPWKVKSP